MMRGWLFAKRAVAGSLRRLPHALFALFLLGACASTIEGGQPSSPETSAYQPKKVDASSGRGGWRDTDIEARGPIVNAMVDRYLDVMEYHLKLERDESFRREWNPPQRPVGEADVRFVWNHPRQDQNRTLQRLYRALIDATPAESMVRLQTAYFAPGKRIHKGLMQAMDRGVRVEVLSNSEETNDIGVVSDASRYAYFKLLKYSPMFRLFERLPRPDIGEETLHSKVASFGCRGPVIVGSFNLDAQSGEHNSESVLLVYDKGIRQAFDAMFEQDLAKDRAFRVTMETFGEVSGWTRFKQGLLHTLGWYWM